MPSTSSVCSGTSLWGRSAYRLHRDHGHFNFTVENDEDSAELHFTPGSMAVQITLESIVWPLALVGHLATRAYVRIEYRRHGDARQQWVWERHAKIVEGALSHDFEVDPALPNDPAA